MGHSEHPRLAAGEIRGFSPPNWALINGESEVGLVRPRSEPYPGALTLHRGKRVEVLAAVVSQGR